MLGKKLWLSLLVALLCGASATSAIVEGTVEVGLEHTDGKGVVSAFFPDGGQATADLAVEEARFRIPKNNNAHVFITDYNPVLFTYESETTTAPTADLEAVMSFIEAIQPFLGGAEADSEDGAMPSMGSRGAVERLFLGNIDLAALEEHCAVLFERLNQISTLIDRSAAGDQQAVEVVKQWPGEKLHEFMKEATAEMTRLRAGVLAHQGLEVRAVTRDGQVAGVISDLSFSAPYAFEERRRDDGIHADPDSEDEFLAEALIEESTLDAILLDEEVRRRLRFAWYICQEAELLRNASEKLYRFWKAYSKIGSERLETVRFEPGVATTVTVKVAPNEAFAEFFSDTAKKHQGDHKGEFKITIEPKLAFHLEFGAGAVYSFVRNPEYAATMNDAGELTLTETTNDYNEFEVAAILNIIRDRDFGTGFEPFVQVGIAPSDNLGFLLGAGFSAFDRLTLSAGVIYQEANRLGSSLEVGQTLNMAEDLMVDTDFKAGLYLQIGVTLDLGN